MMFGRRNPDQAQATPQPPRESDLDLDLLPDLPEIAPRSTNEPTQTEEPSKTAASDPAWHSSAAPATAPLTSQSPEQPAAPKPATPTPAGQQPANSPPAAAQPAPQPAATQPAARPAVPQLSPQPVVPQPVAQPGAQVTSRLGGVTATRSGSSTESVIGPEDCFDGRYRSERGVRIQGTARGSIESRQYIFVEGSAQVEADLIAEDITIAGSFNGKIECRRRLEITSTGKVEGHIQTALLVVQEGGVLDGELHMRKLEGTPASEENKAEKK